MKRKPHIVFVFHNENIDSGASRSLMDIVTKLVESNQYRISAIIPKHNANSERIFSNLGITSYVFCYSHLIQDLNQPFLLRLVKKPVYVIRHCNTYLEAINATKVFKNEDVDIVYSNTSTIIFGGYLGRLLHSKMIWHIREFGKKDHHIVFYLGEKYIEKFINRNADAVLCVSKAVKNEHSKYIDASKMEVSYNSYSEDYILPRDSFNKDNPLQMLLAGDIKPSKGQLETIEALAFFLRKYPEQAILHLAGTGKQKEYLKLIDKSITNNDLSNQVVFHGKVKEMGKLRKKIDIGIVASECEAFGRTTIEGMLSMMCMIGRASGGTLEQIKPMETGLLYDGTPEDLASKMEYLHLNRSEIERMAKQSFDESVELHTKGRCQEIVDKTIKKVLSVNNPDK